MTDMQRGRLNAQKAAITSPTFAQQWLLDATGNWGNFKQDDDGDGTWDLDQDRTANMVNEITDVTETTGPSWVTPAYSLAGNMTTVPQPVDPTASYAAAFDAWNRLVKLTEGANTVQENEYDGLRRRTVRKNYTGGSLDETRHFYYSQTWQVLEERLNTSADPDRQFVWGLRYIDDCVLRDRDTTGNGTLDERLYALQDANWNVTAVADTGGDVQERYAYQAYGQPLFLNSNYTSRTSSSFNWETLFAGYRWDQTTGLYLVRNRVLHPLIGTWMQRDPVGYIDGDNLYHVYDVTSLFDPYGLAARLCSCCDTAIEDAQRTGLNGLNRVRGRTTVTGPRSGRQCNVTLDCKSTGCPRNFPATTTIGRRSIAICLDCRMANANLQQTLVHEIQHARDFCDAPPGRNRASCEAYETSAYEASCAVLFPAKDASFDRCVACGVYFSCRHLGTPQQNPPCDISSGVPTKPCWRYDPRRGFVPDRTDPRCSRFRRRARR